jgi:Protein of unknown function (DUF3365)
VAVYGNPTGFCLRGDAKRSLLISIVPKDDDADVNTSLRRVLIFNAVFIPILALCLGVTAHFVQLEFRQLAEQQVLENAHLMMETAKASRVYTTEQIEPLLTREEARVAQGVKDLHDALNTQLAQALQQAVSGLANPKERQTLQVLSEQIVQNVTQQPRTVPEPQFAAQSIPFYAATEAFNYFRKRYPDYSYKEAALNPTNPRDRTVEWEADVVNIFNRTPSKTDLVGYRETPEGPSLYYSAPIRVDSQSCLSCHASAEDAPREVTKIYGKNNGFGWKLNEIIGAQIVSVPARLVNESADAAVTRILCWLAAGYALVFIVVNLGVYFLARR